MTTKKLTIKAESVDYAIRTGLERLGLPRERTHIRIVQHPSQSMFGHRDAIVAILYDGPESDGALKSKNDIEFRSKFRFRLHDGEGQVHVPSCFYDPRYITSREERIAYLQEYCADHQVSDPDAANLETIAEDYQCQFDFHPIKTFDTLPINEDGARLCFEVDCDKMRARAVIFHGDNGCTVDEVVKVLGKNGIIKGVLSENIKMITERGHVGFFDVARGVPAVDDSPANLDKFFQEDERKEFARMMELLTIDTRQVKEINIAERNQLLLRIGEIIEGKPGYTIEGDVIDKQDISETDGGLKLGPNVRLSDDCKEVYACQSGHIVWRAEEGYVDIEPLYVVEGNVDYNEGNIVDFVGKVLIKGDVKAKFEVTAEGDIEVQGSVEDAVLKSANGNIRVAGSVVHKTGGSIHAARSVHCGIATNAKIFAHEIVIEKEAMNSNLTAEKSLEAIGAPGVIVGGVTQATEIIRANTIGSESWVPTHIHVGDVTELKQRLRALRQIIAQESAKQKESNEVTRILNRRLKSGPLSPAQEEQLARAMDDINRAEEALEYSHEEEAELKTEITSRKSARLEILKELYPQVDVFIYEGHMVPEGTEKYSGFRCKDGRVQRYSL